MRGYDPLTAKEIGADQKYYEKYVEKIYESADKMLGEILPLADEDTLVIVVSDHGATTWINDVPIAEILEKAGLLKRKEDKETGKRPFSLVLRREDARVIGLYGDRVGDIVYALRPEFGHEHGQQLPTAKLGKGSLESVLVMKGPNIKKGIKLNEMVGLQDVVPTICYLMNIPFPKGCQGALIYDALEDPNWKTKKLQRLEKELKRWKAIYEKQISIMHNR